MTISPFGSALAPALVSCLFALPLGASEATPELVVFEGVAVVPMDGERVLRDQIVVVEGDRIRDVAPRGSVEIPKQANVIDGSGRYLMPGLADMHAHLAPNENDLLLFLAYGVTTVRNMWGQPFHLDFRSRIESGELLGPDLHTTGAIFDGEKPLFPGSQSVTSSAEVRAAVRAQKEAGFEAIKVMVNLDPEVYETLLRAAADESIPVYGHVPARVGLRRALGMGQHSFEHLIDFAQELIPADSPARAAVIEAYANVDSEAVYTALFGAAVPTGIDELAAAAAASDAWFCPTLVAMRRMGESEAELERLAGEPAMGAIHPKLRAFWQGRVAAFTAEGLAARRQGWPLLQAAASGLHRAGARLVVGTDAGFPYILPGASVHEELELLVATGLTPFEALRAATVSAAELLGKSDDRGTVAAGQRADLLLLSGDPLENVAATRSRVGVMVRGRWLPQEELDGRLAAIAESYAPGADASRPPSPP